MRIKIKKIYKTAIPVAIVILALAGCGNKEVTDKSGRTINKDGSIRGQIVAEFDETFYNVDELKTMMDDEIRSYNFDHAGEKILAGEVKCEDGILTCVMDYATDEDYAEFNSRHFVVEDFSEAAASDLVRVSVKDVKDMSLADLSTLQNTEKLRVLITDEVGYVTFPGKVKYISDGVDQVTGKQVLVTENMDGLAYVIFEMK